MTARDIKKVQILLTSNDGQHFLTTTENRTLINEIVRVCSFVKIKEGSIGECSIKELADYDFRET